MSLISETLTKFSFGDHIYFFVYAPDYHPLWSNKSTRRKLHNVREITRDFTKPLEFNKLLCTECKKIKLDHVTPICENCTRDSNIMISFRSYGYNKFRNQNIQRVPIYKNIILYDIWSVIYKKNNKKTKNIETIKYFTLE